MSAYCRRQNNAIRTEGTLFSSERKEWIIKKMNELRDDMESGVITGLLACPHQHKHGSQEHALWLWSINKENVDISASASGFSVFGKKAETKADQEKRDVLQDSANRTRYVPNSGAIDIKTAFAMLVEPVKGGNIRACECPFCNETWLLNSIGRARAYRYHSCPAIREEFLPALKLAREGALREDFETAVEEPTIVTQGVSRVNGLSFSFTWTIGDRFSNVDSFWEEGKKEPKPKKASEPMYEKVMDLRGRLDVKCLKRTTLKHQSDLLAIPGLRAQVEESMPEGSPGPSTRTTVKPAVYTHEQIRDAYRERIALGRLRPFDT